MVFATCDFKSKSATVPRARDACPDALMVFGLLEME